MDTDTSPASLPRWYAEEARPRWYAAAITCTAIVLAALVLAAALVDHDLADGVLGFFTGLLGAGLVVVILGTEIRHKRAARRRDAAALEDLEPLRDTSAANRDVKE